MDKRVSKLEALPEEVALIFLTCSEESNLLVQGRENQDSSHSKWLSNRYITVVWKLWKLKGTSDYKIELATARHAMVKVEKTYRNVESVKEEEWLRN